MLANARRLQRKGFTLSEIAEEMDCRRSTIERMLYWEVINDV
jgi:orotate phosphoribosyltransferase-like protein